MVHGEDSLWYLQASNREVVPPRREEMKPYGMNRMLVPWMIKLFSIKPRVFIRPGLFL